MKTRTLLGIGILAIGTTLIAQDAKIAPQQAITKGSPVIHRMDPPPAGVTVLFSNLGSSSDAYDDTNGWLIEGPDNTVTFASQGIANPFTLSANSTLKAVRIALQYDASGTNNAVVALYSDAGGLPGTKIASIDVNNLPTFGTCCALVTVGRAADKGIKLTAGTQYWLVAATDTASDTAFDVWDYTWNDSQGPIAFEGTATGNVWTGFTGNQNAFAIYGTTP